MLWPLVILSGSAIALSTTATKETVKFPSRATPPADVVVAQLEALRQNDVARTFELSSRARRLAIEEASRSDARHFQVKREVVLEKLETALRESCPGLLGHRWKPRFRKNMSLHCETFDTYSSHWTCPSC